MISIVICHTNSLYLKNVSENIAATIGVPYEVVVIDNKQNQYSLCAAYNEGAKRSQYDILCFMHEDILFHTRDWGKLVGNHLADKNIGVIGLCGGKYRSRIPGGWWAVEADYNRQKTIQHDVDTGKPKLVYQNRNNEPISDVVVLDGLWMCCRKEIWKKTGFDEQVFKGFHFYDMDFSLQVFMKGYKNYVIYDISVEHLSNGEYSNDWLANAVIFGKKWERVLPVSTFHLPGKQIKSLEYSECAHFMDILISFFFNRKTVLKYFMSCLRLNFFNIRNIYFGIYLLQVYFPRMWGVYKSIKNTIGKN